MAQVRTGRVTQNHDVQLYLALPNLAKKNLMLQKVPELTMCVCTASGFAAEWWQLMDKIPEKIHQGLGLPWLEIRSTAGSAAMLSQTSSNQKA
jgi:hypothetical protein